MNRAAASCLLLFSLLGCNKLLPHAAGPAPLVDADYQFRLSAPGPGWQLLTETEVRRISPDALAGAMETEQGVAARHGVVTVEPHSGSQLREFATLLIASMPLEDKQTVSMVDQEFEKQPALRSHITGKLNGVELRYVSLIFLHQRHAYQVTSWGMAGRVDEKSLLAFSQGFHLLDGAVHDRSRLHPVADEHGVGYQIKDGVFRSTARGLTVRPGAGWQLTTGDEATQMNSSAEVGLTHGSPEAYLILIATPLVDTSPEEYSERTLRDNVAALSLEAMPGAPWQVTVAAQPVQFHRYLNAKMSLEYLLGIFFHGDTAYLVMTWYEQGFSAQGAGLLQTGLSGIGFLDEPARQALRRELLALPDPQVAIGPTYALRRGVYRDFAQGLSWTKPPGPLHITVGAAARQYNKDATLFFEDRESGLYGVLIVEGPVADAAAYHRAAVEGTSDGSVVRNRATPVRLGPQPALSTMVEKKLNEEQLLKQMVTAVDAAHSYQLMLWGQRAAMKSSAAWVQAVLSGFSFGARTPLAWEGETLTDQRLGFSFHPPEVLGTDLQHADLTPKEVRPLGTIVEWKNARYSLALIAVHTLERGQDEGWFLEQISRLMPGRASLLSSTITTTGELGGEKARRVSFKRLGSLRGELLLVARDRTFYCLAVDGLTSSLDAATLDSIKAGFRFLD